MTAHGPLDKDGPLDKATQDFIRAHRRDDVRQLALQMHRYPDVDRAVALAQIAGWQAAVRKVPSWAQVEGIVYPPHLPLEQCSSEATAKYKTAVAARWLGLGLGPWLGPALGCPSSTGAGRADCPTTPTATALPAIGALGQGLQGQGLQRHSLPSSSNDTSTDEAIATAPGPPALTLADLTGGMGVDCAFMATGFQAVTYVERDALLCQLARQNFRTLGLDHISVVEGDCLNVLPTLTPVDCLFIDPARRDAHGGRVVAMGDCTPDITAIEDLLLAHARLVMVKLSPMLDLTLAMGQLHHVREAHVVAVDGECRELLLVLAREDSPSGMASCPSLKESLPHADTPSTIPHSDAQSAHRQGMPLVDTHPATPRCVPMASCDNSPATMGPRPADGIDDIPITCVNLTATAPLGHPLRFTRRSERICPCPIATDLGTYLYEPSADLLKAGAYRTVAHTFGLEKLHPSTHLYTSSALRTDFPGRRFAIQAVYPLHKSGLRNLRAQVPRAELTLRNFPSTTADLRRRLAIAAGGDTTLMATTLHDGTHVLIACRKV